MPPSTSGVDAVNQILSKVFAGGLLESRIAAYWKPKVSFEGRDVWQLMDGIRKNSPDGIIAELKGNCPAYMVKPGVVNPPKAVPPKAVHTPDPEYTEKARKPKLEGTTNLLVVVNEKGYPGIVELMKDPGEGLDVRALAAVAEWTFKPAMW